MSTSLSAIALPRQPDPTILPIKVGNLSRTGMTAALSASTLTVAPDDSLYRVSAALRTTTGGDALTVTVNALFVDDVGSATVAVAAALSLLVVGRVGGDLILRAQRGTPVRINTVLSGARVNSKYAVEVQLEKLT